jgi:3-hydroxyisobutyrate dehydrogenase-like beta-hydroxyacid dehydrogenase
MTSNRRVAFLGLGTMGYPMAAHLSRAGYDVAVYNRTAQAAQRWCSENRGRHATTPADAAAGAEVVIACVSDDTAVKAVTEGPEGAFLAMEAGTVYVDHTTSSAALAQQLNERAAKRGVRYLDAPVTGGKPGAVKGALTTMVGGDPQALERVRDVLSRYAKVIAYIGPPGAGQITKMANQICIGGILQSLAEALALVEKSGLDASRVLDVLLSGSGRSWQMENRGANMLVGRYDFGFSVEWLTKDLVLCLDEAVRRKLTLPGTEVARCSYATLIDRGFKANDVAAVMRLFR